MIQKENKECKITFLGIKYDTLAIDSGGIFFSSDISYMWDTIYI